jgi:hypothetical protein
MNKSRKISEAFKLLVTLLMIYVFLFAPSHAYASGWSVYSEGGCPGSPEGISVLTWTGYHWYSWGKSWGYLWYWSGSSWTLRSSGYGEAGGAANSAIAYDRSGYQSGWWTQTGAHTASFFSGQNNSYGNQYTCP